MKARHHTGQQDKAQGKDKTGKEAQAGIDRADETMDRAKKVKYLFGIVTCLVIVDVLIRDHLFQLSLPILKKIRQEY